MADDDPDDRLIIEQIFLDIRNGGTLHFVEDGDELMLYLRQSGRYAELASSSLPSLILLDLNMPRKHGLEALAEIKADPDLRGIPVAVWTTSNDERDKVRSRKAGADVFVTKPTNYLEIAERLQELIKKYCFK